MTTLIAFDIVATEDIEVDGVPFTLYYSKSKTSTETKWTAVERVEGNKKKPFSVDLHVGEDVEADFAQQNGRSFTPELKQIVIEEIRMRLPKK